MRGLSVLRIVCLYGLAGLGAFLLALLLLNQWRNNPFKNEIESMLGTGCYLENTTAVEEDDMPKEMERVVDEVRRMVRENMTGYRYPDGKYDVNASKLEDFLIEENGTPVRSVILSTWRTGSTFFGEAIAANIANFHHFEPLPDFDIVQVRGPPLAAKAIKRVKAFLNCDYADSAEFIEYAKTHYWASNKNPQLFGRCNSHGDMCYDHRFLSAMCKLFPFQSMKLVRLRLNIAQELLADEKLAVRMVLLVRDPRGILQSRKHRDWCPPIRDCSDPALLCADMVSDYKIAADLAKKYPTTFRTVRYEDIAVDPHKRVEELSEFYGRYFHPKVKEYLDEHTTYYTDELASYTHRISKSTPFQWRTKFEFDEVEEIQRVCASAMEYWGYVPAINATHLKEFNPVTDYALNL